MVLAVVAIIQLEQPGWGDQTQVSSQVPTTEQQQLAIKRERIRMNGILKEKEAAEIIGQINNDLIQVKSLSKNQIIKKKVIFIYARGQGNLMVAGKETAANTMIELAGAVNAVRDYEGYKPLTAEAVVAAAPDVILLMDSGLLSIGGAEKIWELIDLGLHKWYTKKMA